MFYALCRKQVSAVFAIKFCRGDENSFKTPPIRRRRMARLCLCVPGLNYCRKRAFRKLQIAKVNKFRNKASTIFSGNRVGVLSLFGKTSTTSQEFASAFYFTPHCNHHFGACKPILSPFCRVVKYFAPKCCLIVKKNL